MTVRARLGLLTTQGRAAGIFPVEQRVALVALRKMACRLPRGISQLAVQGHRLALEGAAFSRCPFVDGSGLATLQKNEAPGNLMPRFRWRNGPRARRGLDTNQLPRLTLERKQLIIR